MADYSHSPWGAMAAAKQQPSAHTEEEARSDISNAAQGNAPVKKQPTPEEIQGAMKSNAAMDALKAKYPDWI